MLKQRQRTCRRVSTTKKKTWTPNIPLVGCLAYDTENLFTAGIESSSEEIKEAFGITRLTRLLMSFWSCSKLPAFLIFPPSSFSVPHKIFYNKKVKVSVGPDVTLECGDWENIKTTDGHNKLSSIPCATSSFWMQHDMAVFWAVFQMS